MRLNLTARSVVVVTASLALAATGQAQQKVTLDFWVPGAATEQPYYEKLIAEFERLNPTVDVRLQIFAGTQYFNAINLAFRSNSEPDVLRVAPFGNLPLSRWVEQGWLLPLNPYLTTEVLGRFAPSLFIEGTVKFNNRIYSLPYKRPDITPVMLGYNPKILAEAGLPGPPKTWNELRSYAKKITETGNGRYYGMGFQAKLDPGPYAGFLATAGGFIGQAGTALNYKTGRYEADHPAMVGAVELLRAMNLEDRSVIPGWEGMDHSALADNFAQGKLGMFFAQDWMAGAFAGRYGLDPASYAFAPLPTPTGQFRTRVPAGTPQGFYGITAKTPRRREAWALMNFLYGQRANEMALEAGQSIYPAVRIPKARIDQLSPTANRLLEISEVQNVVIPQPNLIPGWTAVWSKLKPPQPNLATLQSGAIQGQVNYREAAARYNTAFNAALATAIEGAQQEGAKVCREQLLAFSRFDGLRDFGAKDYAALPTCK